MRRISIKGVFIGGIVDIAATNVFGIMAFVMFSMFVPHPPGAVTRSAIDLLLANPGMVAAMYLGGAAASVLGGYVAAWLAKRGELLNGALSAWLCIALGVFGMVKGHDAIGLRELLMLPLSPALGLLGGYLRLALRRRAVQPIH